MDDSSGAGGGSGTGDPAAQRPHGKDPATVEPRSPAPGSQPKKPMSERLNLKMTTSILSDKERAAQNHAKLLQIKELLDTKQVSFDQLDDLLDLSLECGPDPGMSATYNFFCCLIDPTKLQLFYDTLLGDEGT
ncbi:hypothetical protein ACQJBY_057700 [Aegilops geniculata]